MCVCGGGGGGRVKRTISIVNALQKLKRGPKGGKGKAREEISLHTDTLFVGYRAWA